MTIRAKKFTPEILLSYPRRSAAIPNATGTSALYTVSSYDFHNHLHSNEIRLLDIASGQSHLISNDPNASEPKWLGKDDQVAWLSSGNKGLTKLIIGETGKSPKGPYCAAVFQGPVSNLKLKHIGKHMIAVVVTGLSTPSGNLYNPETVSKPRSSGRLYNGLFVRHWDHYVERQKNSIWYGTLKISSSSSEDSINRYVLSPPTLVNVLKNHLLESPVPPFGGTDHFDISETGLVFIAKDPSLIPATHTKTDLYYVSLPSFTDSKPSEPKLIDIDGVDGASASPVFSSDGKQVAFLKMTKDGYESDRNRIFVVPDVSNGSSHYEIIVPHQIPRPGMLSDSAIQVSPSSLWWKVTGDHLYFTAELYGRSNLYSISIARTQSDVNLTKLTSEGSISDVFPLKSGGAELLITSSSLIDNSRFDILSPSSPEKLELVSSNTRNGQSLGVYPSQVCEIWWTGAEAKPVHAWLIKPSNFSPDKKYPLAYLIHGGPQGAWTDSWSTRWNPLIFAEQGYVVVTPNPTGSTGYGQDFTDAIAGHWGGRPYEDLVAGFEFIDDNLKYIDTSRAVALGASYGGYMVNWIQGQPLGRKFKALVTHDGVFSTLNMFSTEELYFPVHDFGGTIWNNREGFEKWDPAKHTGNWKTPHLVIHNELDYRLPISEGLATFNCLQTRGVPSQFLSFPDENHWVLKPENSLVWHQVVLNWINKWIEK